MIERTYGTNVAKIIFSDGRFLKGDLVHQEMEVTIPSVYCQHQQVVFFLKSAIRNSEIDD